jgi:hypothetical protein
MAGISEFSLLCLYKFWQPDAKSLGLDAALGEVDGLCSLVAAAATRTAAQRMGCAATAQHLQESETEQDQESSFIFCSTNSDRW